MTLGRIFSYKVNLDLKVCHILKAQYRFNYKDKMRMLILMQLIATSLQMLAPSIISDSEADLGEIHLGDFSQIFYSGLWNSNENSQADFINSKGGMVIFSFNYNSTTPQVLPFHIKIYEGHFYQDKLLLASPTLDLKEEHQKELSGKSNSDVKLGNQFQLVNTLQGCEFNSSLQLKTIDGKDLDITTDETENISVIGSISSTKCNINFSFKVTPLEIDLIEALLFVFYQIIFTALGLWPFIKAVLSDDPLFLVNLSQNAMIANFMVEYMVTSINMVMSTKILIGYYNLLSFLTIFMIFSCFFKLRQLMTMLEVAENNEPQEGEGPNLQLRFYTCLKLFSPLVIAYFVLQRILINHWLWCGVMLYPLFQIYHNSRYVSRKNCFIWRIHLVAFLAQVSYPIGMKFFDDNIFKTPKDRTFCFVLLGIVLVQLGLMKLQKMLGNLFFLPKSWRKEFSYMRDLSQVANIDDLTCPICMLKLNENPEGEGLNKRLITKYMETPCKHMFHEMCLKKWLDVRSICPCCRLNMPPCFD